MLYADIILPLPMPRLYTYLVPETMTKLAVPGMRAIVPFGLKKVYTGIIRNIHNTPPENLEYKEISSIPDESPAINKFQLELWDWMSDYYMSSPGDVYKAAVPDRIMKKDKLESVSATAFEKYISLNTTLNKQRTLHDTLDKLSKAPKQKAILLKFLELAGENISDFKIEKKALQGNADQAAIASLIKKEIFREIELEKKAPQSYDKPELPVELNIPQSESLNKIKEFFRQKDVCLLHGVTSSGKTEIYIHLISEIIKSGKQVLYLLPEIALSSQIVKRLERVFGNKVKVYHSRISNRERLTIYKHLLDEENNSEGNIILGARSALFLPYSRLGLVIVDEEHENTYKQFDPAPRYHARDTAIVLALIHKAKVLLGTATPSVESWANCKNGKFGLVNLRSRYGDIEAPQIIIANIRESRRKNNMISVFTPALLNEINKTISDNKQVILFQNRRGYASYLICSECSWIPRCKSCDVSLTYHKYNNRLVCHYCGSVQKVPVQCNECGSSKLLTSGFGTELIEDEIEMIVPGARVARLDLDTSRSVKAYHKILQDFSSGKTNILVGTQLIAKGLDFSNVHLVGIINADQMLNYPDFRAYERSFQLMMQVSGRAGRRDKQGKVIIQTYDPSNPVIKIVRDNNFEEFYQDQYVERQMFNYPPFVRMIKITLKHKSPDELNKAAKDLADKMRNVFGKRVLGAHDPVVSRIQSLYLKNIILKIEKESSFKKARSLLLEILNDFRLIFPSSQLIITLDVDPA